MREVFFIKSNQKRWKDYEYLLAKRSQVKADDIADVFIELTNDLSFARTHYPGSDISGYLNDLTSKFHTAIYTNKREKKGRVKRFFLYEVPQVMRASHKQLLTSFLVFGVAFLIGWVSSLNDASFTNLILSDGYVKMTIENIESGDPMGVYKDEGALMMFLYITFNNIRVAMLAFAMGIFLSIGTWYILISNGIMLGTFHALFYKYNIVEEFLLTVYIHGAFEISAIVVAGAAGIVMGNSFLFPGTYTRKHSFKQGAKKGIKIIIGLIPFFIMAGFLEGFVTRYTEMPTILSLFIILGSLVTIFYYFVIYPYRLPKQALA